MPENYGVGVVVVSRIEFANNRGQRIHPGMRGIVRGPDLKDKECRRVKCDFLSGLKGLSVRVDHDIMRASDQAYLLPCEPAARN